MNKNKKMVLCHPGSATFLITLFFIIFSVSAAQSALPPSDSDYDGDVDGKDLVHFATKYANDDPAADLDANGRVDGTDVARFAEVYGFIESFAHVYEVGPGMPYAEPSEVPWESLDPGSLVRIHYRETPYANKWVLAVSATADNPIVVRGIPQDGMLPVITGANATTRLSLDYWNENRSVIKVGGSNQPSAVPSHVTIENLDIKSARPPYTFWDDSGNIQTYHENAAAILVEFGAHITIRNCILRDSGNGFFSGAQSSDLLLEGNYIYDNGIVGSFYEHNSYTQSLGIIFQYNRFGSLRAGCLGQNLKDRSAGTVARYNWIEGGNRSLDLVDSDNSELFADPSYRQTFVYGNVLIKHDTAGDGRVLHYGGDSGQEENYRKGTLWFFNNTVVSYRAGNTTLMRLSSNDEYANCFNNIVLSTADPGRLAILENTGTIDLHHNWLSAGWVAAHDILEGVLNEWENIEGDEPGFYDMADQDYRLLDESICVDAGAELPSGILPDHDLYYQYVRHQRLTERPDDGHLDLGAFEFF
jgi:hypothetical protein